MRRIASFVIALFMSLAFTAAGFAQDRPAAPPEKQALGAEQSGKMEKQEQAKKAKKSKKKAKKVSKKAKKSKAAKPAMV